MDERSSSLQELVAEHRGDSAYSSFSSGYCPPNLQSPRLAALEVAAPDSTMDFSLRNGMTVKSLTVGMLGLQGRTAERDAEVHKWESRLCQRDIEFKDLHREVQEMATPTA